MLKGYRAAVIITIVKTTFTAKYRISFCFTLYRHIFDSVIILQRI